MHETPLTDWATPIKKTVERKRSSSSTSSESEYQTPPEGPVGPVVEQELFMNKLNQSVQTKIEGPSFDLELSSETSSHMKNTPAVIILSSDDDPCVLAGEDDKTFVALDKPIVISSTEPSPSPEDSSSVSARLRDLNRRVVNSTPPDRRRKRPGEEGYSTGSPKRKNTHQEGTASEVPCIKEEGDLTPTPLKAEMPSSPLRASLVRKRTPRTTTPQTTTPRKNTPRAQYVEKTPGASFDSPVSARKKRSVVKSVYSSFESPLSSALDLSSDILSSPLKARRYLQTTDATLMSSSDAFSPSPNKKKRQAKAVEKSSPDSLKSPDVQDELFDIDSPGGISDDFYMDSETDDELKVSYNADDVKQRAEDRLAEILQEVKQNSSSTTPHGGSVEPEDEVDAKYKAAQLKEAERRQQHQEKKEAYYKKLKEEEEAKRQQQLMDAPLAQCETAGIELFSYDTHKIGFRPRHKILKVMEDASLKPTLVLPRQAVDLKFAAVDVQWLLVKLARETVSVERKRILMHLQQAKVELGETDLKKIMKAVGLRYWDARKGSLKNKASAYSTLNKSRRTNSTPSTPVKAKRAGRMNSNQLVTPTKAKKMDSLTFSPLCSFDSPSSFYDDSPSKKAVKEPLPPPPIQYRSAESLGDFFDAVAQLIDPDCIEFLFTLLLLVSSDSSLESLQSDANPAYAGIARLLAKEEFTTAKALEIACDTVDLKSAQARVLQALSCGTDGRVNEFARVCASVFFLREYIEDKSEGELAAMLSTDDRILDSTFLENVEDFSRRSDKSSTFIRHMFGFFARSMDPKAWNAEELRKAETALTSRSDCVDNLDDFKFNASVMSWLSRVSTEFVVFADSVGSCTL
ncbi:hypothetical protein CJU90_3435 [Yarrowia sp. C11]|nr:hypothetical protein CKK34_4882 [Yarrowia sp. E02]KAG5369896.1 hypothetical protein CJU90_3435 [Yarrowia sp. C11]